MPWKLIGFILLGVVLILLLGVNLDNRSNIDFWFNDTLRLENVSICLSFPIVFVLGMLSTLPFFLNHTLAKNRSKKKKEMKNSLITRKRSDNEDEEYDEEDEYGDDE